MSIIKRDILIQCKLNKEEYRYLKKLVKDNRVNISTMIRRLLFANIKPYLSEDEREEIQALIIELNAIGRNFNQLLQFLHRKKSINIDELNLLPTIKDIKDKVEHGKKFLSEQTIKK